MKGAKWGAKGNVAKMGKYQDSGLPGKKMGIKPMGSDLYSVGKAKK